MSARIDLIPSIAPEKIIDYLIVQEIIEQAPAKVRIEKPGEGNMNIVLRLIYDDQTLVLKQSKPFVQKFPDIPAPQERIKTEAHFYTAIKNDPYLCGMMPWVINFDEPNHLLVMEDLGEGKDFLHTYKQGEFLEEETIRSLLGYLTYLHSLDVREKPLKHFPDNLKLRALNHQHIFVLPFQANNGFDLDLVQDGLASIASAYEKDELLKNKVKQLGHIYMAEGTSLIHGDFYHGSWMETNFGTKVIDPEFAHIGSTEFELGVFIGHLQMSGHSIEEILRHIENSYKGVESFDLELARLFAAVEIMRRIIGIAQLPLDMTLEDRSKALAACRQILVA